MARKIKIDENVDLFDAGPDELSEVLAGLPTEDTSISLWRIQPQGPPSYVAEFSPSDFSLEAVKNTYGGGKFKIIAKSNGDTRTSKFSIDGDPKQGMKPVYKRYINGKLVYSKPEDADVIVSDSPRGLNIGNLNGNGATTDNVMMLLLSEIRAMRQDMQRPAEATSKKELIEEMLLFKNLFAQQNPVQDFSKMAMDLIKQGIEVAQLGDGGGGSPWMMLVDKIMPTVQDVLKMVNMQQTKAISMPNQPAINRAEAPAIAQPPLTGFAALANDLAPYLPTFIRAASVGTDPMLMVDMTLPNIPQGEAQAPVIAWLQSAEWFNDLSKLHPAIPAQAAWWNDYRNGLLEALMNPETDETHEGND